MENIFDKNFLKIAFKHFSFSSPENLKIKKIIYNDTIYEGQTTFNSKTKKYEKNGIGIFLSKTGLTFFGQFENDEVNGEGNIFYLDGSFLRGTFENNKLHGMCFIQQNNGDIFLLNFKKGELHGYSTFFPKNDHFGYILLFLCNKYMNKKKSFKFENFEKYEQAKFSIVKEIYENSQISEIFYTEKDIENVLKKKNLNPEKTSLFISSYQISDNYIYCGIFDQELYFNGLGILINFQDQKIKIGDFFDAGIENFGIILQKKYSFFGTFKNGKLHDKVLIKNFETNEFKLCIYNEGSFAKVLHEGKGEFEDDFLNFNKKDLLFRKNSKNDNDCDPSEIEKKAKEEDNIIMDKNENSNINLGSDNTTNSNFQQKKEENENINNKQIETDNNIDDDRSQHNQKKEDEEKDVSQQLKENLRKNSKPEEYDNEEEYEKDGIIFINRNFDISIIQNLSFEVKEISINRKISFAPPPIIRHITFKTNENPNLEIIQNSLIDIQKKKEKKIIEIKEKNKLIRKENQSGLTGIIPVLNNANSKKSQLIAKKKED